ncbi:MAG: succinate dehydrogenase, hydrophobic membrane anchor protein [Armatimonadetes bacterium]|nr:succinate dehydrogenase, hydrophobic membrane anchor protein [Armatimonadota bacterium]
MTGNYRTDRLRPSGSFELVAWVFMRVSGIVLVLMVLGHLTYMHVLNSVNSIDYQFVANRYATPFWRIYDLLMLILAMLHGINGFRTVTEDYVRKNQWRLFWISTLYVLGFIFIVVGALIILTFQPQDIAKISEAMR